MFGTRIDLFTIFGFTIRLDTSWFLLAFLIAWSLATNVFPTQVEGLDSQVYWVMGVVGALALFASIVAHELGHALVARRFGLEMKGITLFIFGGVAEMNEEPPSAKAEFWVAIAGPIVSLVIGLGSLVIYSLGTNLTLSAAGLAVIGYNGLVNLVLVGFNLLPAFPLDGGRVLRSILWNTWGSLRRATRVTSSIGSFFGLGFIVLGAFTLFQGNFIGGMWWFLIGLFLRNAARGSYQQLLLRRTLEGSPVSRFMKTDIITVPRAVSVHTLVEDYIYRHHHKLYPVMDEDSLIGCVTTHDVKALPRDEWPRQSVGAITHPCGVDNTIGPDEDAMAALARMQQNQASRLMVIDSEGRLIGILTLKDLLNFFSEKMELEPA
ncbi:MAG: site-2 protease family protein [Acidobacteriota bacterium]